MTQDINDSLDPSSILRGALLIAVSIALVILPSQISNKRIKVDLPDLSSKSTLLTPTANVKSFNDLIQVAVEEPEPTVIATPEPTQALVAVEVPVSAPKPVQKPVEPVKPPVVEPPAPAITGTKEDWMAQAGIAESDWGYVKQLIGKENHLWCPTRWNGQKNCPDVVTESNPIKGASSAYGLCQALPGSKMASAGSDWQTNPVTQLKWCAMYSQARYGGWANAWSEWQKKSWW